MRTENIFFANPNRQAIISKGPKITPVGDICDLHLHPELEFLYVLSGKMKCVIDGLEFVGHSGEIIFSNANLPHMTECLEYNTEIYLIQFRNPSIFKKELKYLSKFLKQQAIPGYVFSPKDSDYEELLSYIKNMIECSFSSEAYQDYYITANIYNIIAILYRKKFFPAEEVIVDSKLINKVFPIISHINENYNEHLTLETFAKNSNLNKEYLCRLFKKATGATLSDYLNFVRICKAEELFKTGMNISEISYQTGFSSLSYFNRIFKKYKHCNPTVYRKVYSSSESR